MYTIKDLYDLDHTLAADYLSSVTYPWEALKGIKEMEEAGFTSAIIRGLKASVQ